MDFYRANLGVLVATNAYLLWSQYRATKNGDEAAKSDPSLEERGERAKAFATENGRRFQLNFFLPYALAVAADWLQGPHIYAIYKYDKNIPEKVVAALYATGFVSGGISASFAGGYADRFGRKRACLLYCALYIATCLTMLSNDLRVLFVGRFCGGISTTLLFSVFEAWMISDYHAQCIASADLNLSAVFSTMTTLSCIVAIASGVVGDLLVAASGTRTWPFLAAAVCCVGAGCMIATKWNENYGARSSDQMASVEDIKAGVRAIVKDPKILSLSITSCVFEGTMYLFIFFWSAALKSAQAFAGGGTTAGELPFGLIFSCYMCAMMTGSALFTRLKVAQGGVQGSLNMVMNVTLLVSCCLGLAVLLKDQRLLFWVFCLLEGCIGAYFPAMACLKSELVDDSIRGRVYSILRFPLNAFVVIAHSLDEEGDGHRNTVFTVCGSLLLLAFLFTSKYSA
ncbi:major facilitator superfamily transporter [Niveomyces insectorum RCEF 264]|uniref:Molybdate-anion transporter n=1 Tax=Niveomyces insectorum RCEF 264 TaxID=1081102 RepID=A0A167XX52_9HYPO|nr:major facilitator superfamily transporter [Niveomyces insectorum RCEF 264]